mmetsp:Transcript_4207/g.17001  ORF Transcript_4207/g.17001 Transcript_4207/m.17001 type:complete len:250 (-) Transcript_4207:139-888(-)
MYAYCCAAAHLRLRHARLNHLMLSNVGAGDEAWRLSDPVPLGAACGSSADDRQSSVPPLLRRAQPATAPVPTFLHLCDPPPASDDDILTATTWCTPPNSTPCRRDWPPILIPGQNYRLGEWMFAKRRIPSGLFTDCGHPLLAAPPPEVWRLRYELQPPGNPCREAAKRKPLANALAANRTAFVLCLATAYVNAAATRARSGCAAPPNASVRLFDLATRCDRPPGRRAAPTTRVVVVRSPQSPQSRAAAR